MKMPEISIIIPTYNRFNFLEQCIKSISDQTYSEFEVLIVDDGSKAEVLNQIKSLISRLPHYRLIVRTSSNSGASASRNLGLANASGKYIIFLDSDDILAPHCLQQRIEVMNHNPKLAFAVFPMLLFHEKPNDTNLLWNLSINEPDINRFLRLDSVWQTTGPIWRKESLLRIGGFDDSLACWQDVDIHLKALFSGLKYKIFEDFPPDVYYRKHQEGSISQNSLNSNEKIKSRLRLFNWAYQELKAIRANNNAMFAIKEMLLGILLSMGTTLQLGLLLRSINEPNIRQFISRKEKLVVITHALLYKTRLYKIRLFLKHQNKKLDNLFSPKYVGKFTC